MKRIKVMADYFCNPLWAESGRPLENSEFDELGITQALSDALISWAKQYDDTLNQDYPPDSGFVSEEVHKQWIQKGLEISKELVNQIGKDWEVTYFNDETGEEQRVPLPE